MLADGHHHFFVNQQAGETSVFVEEIADLSHLSEEEFWTVAEENGWAYPYDNYGNYTLPPLSFDKLINDPNRFFAVITKRTYSKDLSSSKGAEYPIWIKVANHIPFFIELHIATALWNAGLIYDEKTGREPDEAFYEQARAAIVDAQIEGLTTVPKKTHFTDIELSNFLGELIVEPCK